MTNARRPDDTHDPVRRALLLRSAVLGMLMGSTGWSTRLLAAALDRVPARLPAGRSVYEIRGDVTVNGQRVTTDTLIRASDTIRTGSNSYLITAVGDNAFLIRENSVLEMAGETTIRSLRLLTGKLLGVFGRQMLGQPIALRTVTATIGIRGTGLYAEAYPDRTYLCTCYGTTELAAANDPKATEKITSRHHDAPRWILAEPEKGRSIIPASVNNHTDEELMTLEALVGRKPPFGAYETPYERPRREY